MIVTEKVLTEPVGIAKELATFFKERPIEAVGTVGGIAAFGFGVPAALKAGRKAIVRLGAERVAAEEVISPKVLKGRETLPTVRSIQESIAKFRAAKTPEGRPLVVHAAPEPPVGLEIGRGPAGWRGLEDPGLFVTPMGEASIHFAKAAGREAKLRFTLVPELP